MARDENRNFIALLKVKPKDKKGILEVEF
jgi:hypothetical protein